MCMGCFFELGLLGRGSIDFSLQPEAGPEGLG